MFIGRNGRLLILRSEEVVYWHRGYKPFTPTGVKSKLSSRLHNLLWLVKVK
jgi:hypothetical protein